MEANALDCCSIDLVAQEDSWVAGNSEDIAYQYVSLVYGVFEI